MAPPLSPPPRFLGTAGWSIPRAQAAHFPAAGSHLERYARVFNAAEINSSFYHPHQPATFARWAASVPPSFRFSVKIPKTLTHDGRLAFTAGLASFLSAVGELGPKLGPLLIQLPPSLALEARIAGRFFTALRRRCDGPVACEPRHPSWFSPAGETLLSEFRIARVAADPAVVPAAAQAGGWSGLLYTRLHGSPRTYYSSYGAGFLNQLARRLRSATAPSWCIFDNTALGAAAENALALGKRLAHVR